MMTSLKNEQMTVGFSSKGGELQSLRSNLTGIEYMWSGNPDYWGKHSPILFPIVGGLKDNTYYYKDKPYTLPRHGFARDQEFEVHKISDSEVLFQLTHSEETLKVYPFQFTLGIRYTIHLQTLTCTYEVSNPGNQSLLFSIGAHPAFAVPIDRKLNYSDYSLHFNKDTALEVNQISHDLIDDETEQIALISSTLPLKHELFYQDALVLKSLKSNRIKLETAPDQKGLEFEFNDFPFFGIWAAKDADFICLEPWCGIADGINHNQQLVEKEGIQTLLPHENWTRSWKVSYF